MGTLEYFRPMLSLRRVVRLEDIPLPVMGCQKLSGIRAYVFGGKLRFRRGKILPNLFVRILLERDDLEGLDGELKADKPGRFYEYSTEPFDFVWHVQDNFRNPDLPAEERLANLAMLGDTFDDPHIHFVKHSVLKTRDELKHFFESALAEGKDGVVLRRTTAPYKMGESTLKDGCCVELKDKIRDEGRVLEVVPNRAGTAMSSLRIQYGITARWKISQGFTARQRRDILKFKDQYVGKLVKFVCTNRSGRLLNPLCFDGWRYEF